MLGLRKLGLIMNKLIENYQSPIKTKIICINSKKKKNPSYLLITASNF